ncbi:MAG: MATE family efflux transporter [Christensenellales bacterium]
MRDFTQGNPLRQIAVFALPVLIGNIFQQVYSMVDAIVVGQLLGGKALAAVGVCTMLLNFLLSVLIGLTTGASVVVSQFYGAKKMDELKRTVCTNMIFLLALSLLISLVSVAGSGLLLRLLDTPQDIFDDAQAYLRIMMAGTVFAMLFNIYSAFMRAFGESKIPLYFLIFSTILNIGLDYAFVAWLHMGVAGAAYATVISQALAAFLCWFHAKNHMRLLHVDQWIFDKKLCRLTLRHSIPAAVQMSVTSLATLTLTRLVNTFGSISVAGYTAAIRMDAFVMMPLQSLSMSASTFVAQNIGAGSQKRAKKGLHATMTLMVSLAVILSAFIFIFCRPMIALFIDSADINAASIVAIGVKYLTTLAYFYVLFAVFFAFNGFFRGVGDAVIVMILTISSLSIRAVAAYWLAHQFNMGPEAIAYSIPIGWGLCCIACFIYYKKRLWAGKAAVSKGGNVEAADA